MSRPKPLTEAEITFAEAVAMGKSYKTAAELAGIKGYGSAACKIAERPKVAAYILQLSEEMTSTTLTNSKEAKNYKCNCSCARTDCYNKWRHKEKRRNSSRRSEN